MDIHTLYAVNIATAESVDVLIDQISNQDIDAGITELLLGADGNVDPDFVADGNQEPRITFTTSAIATALASIGIDGLKITSDVDDDGLECWFRKVEEGGARAAGAENIKLTVNKGMLIPTTLTAPHNDVATLEYLLITVFDGTNDPIVILGSQDLEGTANVSEAFCAGPANINGVNLPGVQEITFDFGIDPFVLGADGIVWPNFTAIRAREPLITIRTLESAALSTFGLSGTAQGATDTVLYLRKIAKGGTRVPDVTAEHISLTIDDGMIRVPSTGGSHNDPQEATVEIRPTYDGSNAIVAIDTAVAIVTP